MSETFAYENLIAGSQQSIVSAPATVALGQDLSRGDLVGRILRAVGDVEADPTNTGEGTISGGALGAKAKVGTYTIECIDVGVPAIFSVLDPDGIRLADATAEAAYDGPIAFLIEAYGTPFALGDTFTFDVDAGTFYVKQATLTATDGSAEPYGIMSEDVDATAAATLTSVYVKGEFADAGVGFAGVEDADDWRETCAAVGIYLRTTETV